MRPGNEPAIDQRLKYAGADRRSAASKPCAIARELHRRYRRYGTQLRVGGEINARIDAAREAVRAPTPCLHGARFAALFDAPDWRGWVEHVGRAHTALLEPRCSVPAIQFRMKIVRTA